MDDYPFPEDGDWESGDLPGEEGSGRPVNLGVAIVVALILAVFISGTLAAIGAPSEMAFFMFIIVVLGIVGAIASGERDRKRLEEARRKAAEKEEDDRERLKKEVAQAVKETLRETVKVRCRYCGSLNDEGALKCDSCGATL